MVEVGAVLVKGVLGVLVEVNVQSRDGSYAHLGRLFRSLFPVELRSREGNVKSKARSSFGSGSMSASEFELKSCQRFRRRYFSWYRRRSRRE